MTTVLTREWLWQPVLPLPIWLMICVLAVALAVGVYRSRRVRIPSGQRITLALLRSGTLLLAAGLLLQPTMRSRLARTSPRALALLVDVSGSMTARDRADQPETRQRLVIASLSSIMTPARKAHTRLFCFDEQTTSVSWSELTDASAPASNRRTDIADALRSVRAIAARQPETQIVLISDGADTVAAHEGALLAAARETAQAGLTLHTVLVGEDKLPTLTIEPATEHLYAFINDPIRVPVRLTRQGLSATAANLTITAEGRSLTHRGVEFPPGATTTTESFDLSFDRTGLIHCRFQMGPVTPPITLQGNPSCDVRVIDQPVRVLYLERQPRWTFQFLRNAFQRDRRFDARLVLLGSDASAADLPTGDSALSDTDIVILGDVAPQDLTSEWWQRLHDSVVNDGVGLVLACGPANLPGRFLDSTLAELLPFRRLDPDQAEPQEPWPLKLTPAGRWNPIMQMQSPTAWDALPGLYWCAPVRDLKPAAQVLAEKPATADSPASPVMLLQRVGLGTVLFVGTDETWRWRYEIGDASFYRFWAQAALFAGLPHRTPSPSTSMPTSTQATDLASLPTEQADVRARPELMKQLANETGGEHVPLKDLPALLDRLERHPVREQWSQTLSLWDRWPTLAILVTLVCAEWLLRRRLHLP